MTFAQKEIFDGIRDTGNVGVKYEYLGKTDNPDIGTDVHIWDDDSGLDIIVTPTGEWE